MPRPLTTGIYGIVGRPGSGKSLLAVREMKRIVIEERRPVYTSVPIEPIKFRAWIAWRMAHGGRNIWSCRKVGNLVRTCTRVHFDAFCQRLQRISQTTEHVIIERGGDPNDLAAMDVMVHKECVYEAMRRVTEQHGEPIVTGRGANWFPPGSCFFLDEIHKWYPSTNRQEDPAILAFTSMHRHLQMCVFVITQRWKNVSLTWRAMSEEVWHAINFSKMPLLGPFRLHKWINIFHFTRWQGIDIDNDTDKPKIGAKPILREYYCPELTGAREYDVYRSYSHGGDLADQQHEMAVTAAAMMGQPPPERDAAMAGKEKRWNPVGWFTKNFIRIAVLYLVFSLGWWMKPDGTAGGSDTAEAAAAEQEPVSVDAGPAVGRQGRPTLPRFGFQEGRRISGMRNEGVQVGTRFIAMGDTLDGMYLVGVEAAEGDSAWLSPMGDVWRWRAGGDPEPGVLPAELAPRVEPLRRELLARAALAEAAARASVDDPARPRAGG